MRNRFSRKRAPNGALRYLTKRQTAAPRGTYTAGGNRRHGVEASKDVR